MDNKEIKDIKRNLKKIQSVCNTYSKNHMKNDLDSLTPKDRLFFFLQMSDLVLKHKDLFETENITEKNTVVVDFF